MADTGNQRRRINDMEMVRGLENLRRWTELPEELLLQIFRRLPPKDLFWVVSSVCRSWQLLCWDHLFWKNGRLVLAFLKELCYTNGAEEDTDMLGIAVMRVLKSVFTRDGYLFEDINRRCDSVALPLHPLSDKVLLSVAERTRNLQSNISVLNMDQITGKGFSRAVRNWKQLRGIYIAPLNLDHFTHVINEIGINCKRLKVFGILLTKVCRRNFILDEYTSVVIVNSLRNLEFMHFDGADISRLGLKILMTKCKSLQRIDLKDCFRVLDDQKCKPREHVICLRSITAEIRKTEGGKWPTVSGEEMHDDGSSVINSLWNPKGKDEENGDKRGQLEG